VELTAPHSHLDLSVAQAAGEQLLQRHDSPLPRGESRDEQISGTGELTTYTVGF
jgi:hypothetical protein